MINLSTIESAKNGKAWKTRAMKGYLKKTTLAAETWGEGAYKVTFVNASGTEYDFYFNVGTTVYTGTIPNAANLTLDMELLGHILNDSWFSGEAADFEQARGGTGTW